ncbi:hypothetical protein MPSEU_000438200 [Mayamaea pseudoterrestris]|nr:hypothetical protein MPSEU_000438200 [Mayamaea pseudoterrestris]
MIPVTLTQGVTDGHADRAPNHTLEDVAEEILNGMFCTYEPPPPTRKPKKRGILRAPKMFRRNRSDQSSKSVRWSDTAEENEDDAEPVKDEDHASSTFHCNITQVCMDAGIEAGCFSPSNKIAKQEIDRKKKKSKSKRNNKLTEEIVFDEEGNPKSLLSGKVVAPPSPPPPRTKESFVPQLCGVKINCNDDEDHMEELAKSNRDGPSKTYHRPKQSYDYDDDLDNSLVDEEEEDEENEDTAAIEERHKQQHQAILKKRMKKLREKQEKQRRKKAKESGQKVEQDADWDDDRASNVSVSSSFFRRVFSKKDSAKDDNQTASRGRTASKSRSPSPGRRTSASVSFDEDEALDPIQMIRAEGKPNQMSRSIRAADDWDESLPIIPVRQQKIMRRAMPDECVTRNYRQPIMPNAPASPATRNKIRDPSPGINRTRSRSADDKEVNKTNRWSLPSMGGSKNRGSRSKSPSRARSNSPSRHAEQDDPLRVVVLNGRQGSLTRRAMENFNYMHPTHPLIRNPDDAMERDSMIMAHRHGMDGTLSANSDQMERQSYITAHREGFIDTSYWEPPHLSGFGSGAASRELKNGAIHPMMSRPGYYSYDDMLERQSFITASRQDFDKMPQTRACGLMNTVEEEKSLMQDPIRIAAPTNAASRPSTGQTRGQARQDDISDIRLRERIRTSLDALPEAGYKRTPSQQSTPAQYLLPQATSRPQQDEGSCCSMQYRTPGEAIPQVNHFSDGPSVHNPQIHMQRSPAVDRRLQAQQQAQLQRQYYERVQKQQASRTFTGSAKAKAPGRRQKSAFSLPFFRRSRSRSPVLSRSQSRSRSPSRSKKPELSRSQSRSRSPSRSKNPQQRTRSLDRTDVGARAQAGPVRALPMPQSWNGGSYPYPNPPPTNEQLFFYQMQQQQQLAMQQQQQQQHHIQTQHRQQALALQQASHDATVKVADAEQPTVDEKEITWEERTKQAWERLRTGLTFESAKAEDASEVNNQIYKSSLPAIIKEPEVKKEEKAETAIKDEQPSLFQSALAMLTSAPGKEETNEVQDQVAEASHKVMPLQGSPPPVMQQYHSMQLPSYPSTMPMYAYQLPPGQSQHYPPWTQIPMQAPYHSMSLPVLPGSPPLQTPNNMVMPQMMMSQQTQSGASKHPSVNNRRVSFGGRTEQAFTDDYDENLASPGKRKIFKGTKLITGLFGRNNGDQQKHAPSKEQTDGLLQTHTKSTDLSSCPSTYTLSEEWDGGPYLYSAGPVSPHVPSVVDNSSVDSGCLDTLSHLRMQVNRGKENPKDPSGPIAV